MIWEEYKKKWLRDNTCNFCEGSRMHTCTSYECRPASEEAERYFERIVVRDEIASGKRIYTANLFQYIKKDMLMELGISGIWLLSGNRKEEIVIRFSDNIPKMQQAVYVRYIMEYLKNLEANTREDKSNLPATIDKIPSRIWQKSDEEKIKNGIPLSIKEDAKLIQQSKPDAAAGVPTFQEG